MKVAILTNEYPPNIYGGAGVHVDYLVRVLRKLIDVHVAYFGSRSIHSSNLIVKGYKSQLRVEDRFDQKIGKALDALSINLQMINEFPSDADIIHTHTWYSALAGILARMLYGIPHILTTHSLEPLRSWKREQLGRGFDLSSWIEKMAIEGASGIIAVSKETKNDIIEYFDVPESKIKVIHNGIDLEEYRPTKSKSALEKHGIDYLRPYVFFVGRITRQKGIIHLVNAVKYIDKSAQIVLCAGAPDTREIAQEMKMVVLKAKKVNAKVIWIEKMLPKAEVIELYSHASVFCCPSVYEPFGIINLEAMACGVPVVATKTGGIVEVVEDGKTGFLVPFAKISKNNFEPKKPEDFSIALAKKINIILQDDDLSSKFSRAGRKRVEDHFSWDAIGKQTVEYYKTFLKKAKKK